MKTIRAIAQGASFRSERIGYSNNARMLDGAMFVKAAYSFRHLVSDYGGPLIWVFRDSDSAVKNFYPAKDGWVDTAEITAWLNGSTGDVGWYDQSGNARDIETTTANLNLTGVNGHPTAEFSGKVMKSRFSMTGTALSFLQASRDNARQSGGGPDYYWGLALSGSSGIAFGAEGDAESDYLAGDYVFFGKGSEVAAAPRFISDGGQTSAPTALEVWSGILSADRATLRRDGSALTSRVAATGSDVVAANQLAIGAKTQTVSDSHIGVDIGELIFFTSDINSDVAAYEAALTEAWS